MFCIVPRAVEVGSCQTGLFPSAMLFSFPFCLSCSGSYFLPCSQLHSQQEHDVGKPGWKIPAPKRSWGKRGGDLILKAIRGAFTFTMDTGPL